MRKPIFATMALALTAGTAAATDLSSVFGLQPTSASPTIVPRSGLSLGVGGNLNIATFSQQNLFLAGTSQDVILSPGPLNNRILGTGWAGWNTHVNLTPQVRVGPIVQVNYFNHFGDSDWMWGVKASYTYLNSAAASPRVLIPQFGAFNDAILNITDPFYGTYTIGQYQTRINHQFVLTPYIGRSFANGFFYVGGGPSLSQLQTNLNRMLGIRNSGGQPINQTGIPANAQDSLWVFGGAATVGINYFLTQSWYLDFNYTFSNTRGATSYFTGWYAAPDPQIRWPGLSLVGMGYVPANTSGSLNTQSVNLSLNYILYSAPFTQKNATDAQPRPPVSLTGPYAGLNIGAGWGANGGNPNNWNIDGVHGGVTNNVAANGAGGGVIGGGQIGYNFAFSPMLTAGAEADFQGTSLGSGGGVGPGPLINLNAAGVFYFPGARGGGISVGWFGTIRGRAGVTPLPSLLIYGTGGFAYAHVQRNGWSDNGSVLQTGWTAGGGVEWMFMPNWSAKAEYLYTDVSGGGTGWSDDLLLSLGNITTQTPWNTLRVGVNYHFDWGA